MLTSSSYLLVEDLWVGIGSFTCVGLVLSKPTSAGLLGIGGVDLMPVTITSSAISVSEMGITRRKSSDLCHETNV